jgi:hypothetical protein
MAEWSMAVVLKTSSDRLYQGGYIFAGNFLEDRQKVARCCAISRIFEATLITDQPNFSAELLI